MAATLDKIDMSLDDIIKQGRGRGGARGRGGGLRRSAAGGRGNGAQRGQITVGRGRGGQRVPSRGAGLRGGKLNNISGRGTDRGRNTSGRGIGRGRNQGQSQGGYKKVPTQISQHSFLGPVRGAIKLRNGRGRGSVSNYRQWNLNQVKQNILSPKQKRQNVLKLHRGMAADQIVSASRKKKTLVSDQVISQQKLQRRWKTKNFNKQAPVMTVSVDNKRYDESDVKILVGRPKNMNKRRLNRTFSNASASMIDPGMINVTSPVQIELAQDVNKNQRIQMVRRGRGRGRGGSVELAQHLNKSQQRHRGRGGSNEPAQYIRNQERQLVKRVRGRGRGRGGPMNQGTRQPPQDEDLSLQEQLRNLKPSVQQTYIFKRQDFGRANTGMTLSERFKKNAHVDPSISMDQLERHVFL